MPSSTSKQISYPCPLIGNSGDYIESAKVNWGHFVERFPKKVIFHFQKPEITDERFAENALISLEKAKLLLKEKKLWTINKLKTL